MRKVKKQHKSGKARRPMRSSPRPLHEILMRELLASSQSNAFKKIWAKINSFHAEKIARAACYCTVNTLLYGSSCGTFCRNHHAWNFDVEHLAVLGLAGHLYGDSLEIYVPGTGDDKSATLRIIWGWLRSGAVPGRLDLHNYLETRALAEVKRRRRHDG